METISSRRKRDGELPSTVLLHSLLGQPSRPPRFAPRADSGAFPFRLSLLAPLGTHQNPSRIYPSFQPLAQCPSRNPFLLTSLQMPGGVGDRVQECLKIYFNCGGISTGINHLQGADFTSQSHGPAPTRSGSPVTFCPQNRRCSRSSGAAVTPMRRSSSP